MRKEKLIIILVSLGFIFASDIYAGIQGEDDRIDYWQAEPGIQKLADSVVSLWYDVATPDIAGTNVKELKLQHADRRCAQTRFKEQNQAQIECSGALVAPDLVLTAGHCVPNLESCLDTRIVFGYSINNQGGTAPETMPKNEVYSCIAIKAWSHSDEIHPAWKIPLTPDYALLKLDRKVLNHAPLPIARNHQVNAGDEVFLIGYPNGLPLKISLYGKVLNSDFGALFSTDLDAQGGTSGGPVFDAQSGEIIGIHSRALTSITHNGRCVETLYYRDLPMGEIMASREIKIKPPLLDLIPNTTKPLY